LQCYLRRSANGQEAQTIKGYFQIWKSNRRMREAGPRVVGFLCALPGDDCNFKWFKITSLQSRTRTLRSLGIGPLFSFLSPLQWAILSALPRLEPDTPGQLYVFEKNFNSNDYYYQKTVEATGLQAKGTESCDGNDAVIAPFSTSCKSRISASH
jgi:hypothetical protein